ncbi:type I restriction-modification system subunit M [Mycoplasmopsis synoviae]|uniref:type I restriction-modification system subunit M n=1 Tax=Mycoplasmopsis synoviae TaxID=2109 RepID=UPI0034DABE39
MTKQKIASAIWDAANEMRGNIDASRYKDYILGFIFYKLLSVKLVSFINDQLKVSIEKLEKYGEENKDKKDDEIDENYANTIEQCIDELGYFIKYKNLFSTWIKNINETTNVEINDALIEFKRNISNEAKKKNLYRDIFESLQDGIKILGESDKQKTENLRKIISLIDKNIQMNNNINFDTLGFVYEYLISNFAAGAGKKAGEFYTPYYVSSLMSKITAHHLKDKKEINIYDPTSGSGSLLIHIGEEYSKYGHDKNSIIYFAQDLQMEAYKLTRMNLIIRNILPNNIYARNGDTLSSDWPYFDSDSPEDSYKPLFLDAVVSNPPYSLKWNNQGRERDERFKEYGVAPASKADYAFVLHDLYHINPEGIVSVVLPHGVLFRGGTEGKIRKALIEKNQIDTIIGLPYNIFFGTGIPTIIMILKKQKNNNDILFVDASLEFKKDGNKNILEKSNIEKIFQTVIKRENVENFAKVVSLEEIRKSEYNLNINRYVNASEKKEELDVYGLLYSQIPNNELDEFKDFWNMFPTLKKQLVEKINDSYSVLKDKDILEVAFTNEEFISYLNSFKNKFKDFSKFLENKLLNENLIYSINLEELTIKEFLSKFEDEKLIDKFKAAQYVYDHLKIILEDLDLINSEGMSFNNLENSNKLLTKIFDDLKIQEFKFKSDLEKIEDQESKVVDLKAKIKENYDSLSDDIKDNLSNKNKTDFDFSLINKVIKEDDTLDQDTMDLLNEVKKHKNEIDKHNQLIKSFKSNLKEKTENFKENANEKDLKELLKWKWIDLMLNKILELPDEYLEDLSYKLNLLKDKYGESLEKIENEISQNENELISLLKELNGNDYDMKGINEFIKILQK